MHITEFKRSGRYLANVSKWHYLRAYIWSRICLYVDVDFARLWP